MYLRHATHNLKAAPPSDLSDWFASRGDGSCLPSVVQHDLYAIGTQEGALSDKEWSAVIKKHIGDGYEQVECGLMYARLSDHSFRLP